MALPVRDFDDPWIQHLYLMLDLYCEGCGFTPDLSELWNAAPPGEEGALEWSNRAANQVENDGWKLIDGMPYCPKCSPEQREH